MGYSVVVAEDEPLLLENLIQKIERSNMDFHVTGSAQTGAQAYDLIADLTPDLLITDIRMPVMNGLDLIQKAQMLQPDIDCIIISGYSDFEYAQAAVRYHVHDYLLKPVDIDELTASLGKLREHYYAEQKELEQVFAGNLSSQSPQVIANELKEYIISHFNEDFSLNLIAATLNYSPGYLTKIFCQQFDMTPSKFLINHRIQKAKHLLVHNEELSVRQIGEAVGYPEQGYFSRIFKKQTGQSPIEYREQSLNNTAE